ncbi:hypothetical protein C0Q70_15609 [Pomacea canaliculata]|uniref:Uncharacterized protein n=1 Tax=Pomacea canaliculata TaxID=400727 RepID=A0A2T7NVB6_POMCA|nr:uncharacterized protein LOC112572750 [Pomacea canaliculata]XP_025108393.1 uncharacterized protein LOC112572750 [Pomacea canaliculata]XP_025108394.1 uncharacterized protein LOC112572750 [Pomacea canaliculata]PVD25111.1 hypothetical protein C0Q70_15609 [Pomacea canaliculata]
MAQNVGESRGGEGHVMTHQATPGSHAMERTAAGAVTEDEEEENPKSSVCCLQGCLAGTAVGFSFFVALPSGILLVVFSTNSNDRALLIVGVVLVILPLFVLIIVIVLCLNQRRLARLRKRKTGENSTSTSSSSS